MIIKKTFLISLSLLFCVLCNAQTLKQAISESSRPQRESEKTSYVDLGLSVKWATCNIGASKPEEYGNYYVWRETSTKSTYEWRTYKCFNDNYKTQITYVTSSSFRTFDENVIDFGMPYFNNTTLGKSADVANITLGGKWRMPTFEEWKELVTMCTCTWTIVNGVVGYKVEAVNGNSIFLPAAGSRNDMDFRKVGHFGYYWSSSLDNNDWDKAHIVRFDSYGFTSRLYSYDRFEGYGLSVRPVVGSE